MVSPSTRPDSKSTALALMRGFMRGTCDNGSSGGNGIYRALLLICKPLSYPNVVLANRQMDNMDERNPIITDEMPSVNSPSWLERVMNFERGVEGVERNERPSA